MFNVSIHEISQMTKDELEIFIRLIKRDRNEIRINLTKQMKETENLLNGLTRIRETNNLPVVEESLHEMQDHYNRLDRILDALDGPIELRPTRFPRGKTLARRLIRELKTGE